MSKLKSCLFGSCDPNGTCAQIGYAAFRIFIGAAMALGHGLGKIKEPSNATGMVENLGMPAPFLLGWCLILSEFVGGILIAIGLLTRPAAYALAITMGIAWYLHYSGALGEDKSGFGAQEKALLYFFACVVIASFGSGKFGVDRCLSAKS